jgi:hypothetical protein
MATSGSVDFSVTTGQIIKDAYIYAGILDEYDTVDATQFDFAKRQLNIMCKQWCGRENIYTSGFKMWLRDRTDSITLKNQISMSVVSGGDVNINPPTHIMQAFLVETDGSRTELIPFLAEDQAHLDQTEEGTPTHYYYQRGLGTATIYFDQKVDTSTISDYKLSLHYLTECDDFDASGNDPDFPKEWYDALITNLAVKLQTAKQIPVSPDLRQAAAEAVMLAQTFDPQVNNMCFEPERY